MYLTYDEYEKIGGSLSETAFNACCTYAEMKIRAATFNRITEANGTIKNCMARIIEIISKTDILNEKVSSFSHDGLSQTFSRPSAEDCDREIGNTIYGYLMNEYTADGTPLLYCGVKP